MKIRPSPRRPAQDGVNRRKFLASVAVAGTASTVPLAARAETRAASPASAPRPPSALPPSMRVAAAETGTPKDLSRIGGVAGSDFMVDVIKSLDIKYLPANPASSFRGLHESLINYGGNTMPEFLTCAHEESAVAMGHGYFKAAGKPLMTLCHGTVGMQHASMAIYNAWCDRVPVIVVGGNDLDAAHRPPGVPTIHSAQDTRWYATTPNGTTRPSRCSILRSRSCAPTRSQRRRPMGRSRSRSMPACSRSPSSGTERSSTSRVTSPPLRPRATPAR